MLLVAREGDDLSLWDAGIQMEVDAGQYGPFFTLCEDDRPSTLCAPLYLDSHFGVRPR
jgi:hypothetical protein